jgi:hypothetical protein
MSNIYSCKDFYLASFLVASGCKLSSHTRAGTVTTFHFQNSSDLEKLVDSYFAFQATVNPLVYGHAMRTVKTLFHSLTNEHDNENSNPRTIHQTAA